MKGYLAKTRSVGFGAARIIKYIKFQYSHQRQGTESLGRVLPSGGVCAGYADQGASNLGCQAKSNHLVKTRPPNLDIFELECLNLYYEDP